ncbi:hypothetical protein D3C86_2207020 [compost metagenome]
MLAGSSRRMVSEWSGEASLTYTISQGIESDAATRVIRSCKATSVEALLYTGITILSINNPFHS